MDASIGQFFWGGQFYSYDELKLRLCIPLTSIVIEVENIW